MKSIYLLFLFCGFASWSSSQISFQDETLTYNPSLDLRSGNAGACVDLNNDGLDDLVIIDKATHMFIGYNQGAGVPMRWLEGPKVSSSREFMCLVTDLENDGIKEIITSGSYTNSKVYKVKSDGNYVFSSIIMESIFAQGGNSIDLNNDGYLDFYLCNDDGNNLITLNDSTGKLVPSMEMINWDTNPASDNSGNYASEWADVNGDGLVDLAIAKCRLGVSSVTDPRRINRLFIQQADGSFVDEATERGFASGYQSWTSNLVDFDNDGDLDCFVTNHDHEHQLFINDGNGYFFEKPVGFSIARNFAFQSIVRDFDNNGFMDLFLPADDKNLLLLNEGDAFFTIIEDPISSFATGALSGDINNDGLADIIAFYPTSINLPGQIADRIFINTSTNANNYLQIELIGIESNVLGIGSEVTLYSNLGAQKQVVKSGESYGICLPFALHFGLGEFPVVDSIVVNWPKGGKSILKPEVFNKKYTIVEGRCSESAISHFEPQYYCGDSILLDAPTGFKSYTWSTGDTTQQIYVDNYGVFQLSMVNDSGCVVRSQPIIINEGTFKPPFIAYSSTAACNGDTIILSSTIASDSYLWSNSVVDSSTNALLSGKYTLQIIDNCLDTVEDSIRIHFVDSSVLSSVGDTVAKGEDAILYAKGEEIYWYEEENDDLPIYVGDSLIVANLQTSEDYFIENRVMYPSKMMFGGLKYSEAKEFVPLNSINYFLFLQVFKDIVIEEVVLNAIVDGKRKFIIMDETLKVVDSVELFVNKGLASYHLGLKVPPGNLYYFGTDEDVNLEELGTSSPQFYAAFEGQAYPYEFENYVDILSSTGSKSIYPYFYDIKINADYIECISDREVVFAYIDKEVSTEDVAAEKVSYYPNPTSAQLNILFQTSSPKIIQLLTAEGRLLQTIVSEHKEINIDLQSFQKGLYLANILSSNGRESFTFIKI